MKGGVDISFSNLNRAERIESCLEIKYDLIIIGGGITGAGIASDAAARGLKTLLLEKQDFASGTSSKSTKLIHGGLRYLKQLEFGLVKETGLERAVAHKNIPHLVHPETMLLPIVDNGEFTKLTASLAIFVYDYLAKVEQADKKKSWNKTKVLEVEPLLNPDVLKSGIAYSEYRTDDARLTMELVKLARREGAEAINYMEVIDFDYQDETVRGVHCLDSITNKKVTFKSNYIVSAAGPWVDKLREMDGSKKGKSLHLTKGVHIVVPKDRLNLNHSVYFDAFDGRMLFAIPRGKVTYIGTSDTNYDKSLDRVLCTNKDVDYILDKVIKIFPSANITKDDVISSWAGLRPLIHEKGKSPSELSRKDEIFISESNLISIAGGKLTGFRKMSKKIVDLLLKKDQSLPQSKCKTKRKKIHVNSFESYADFENYHKELHDLHKEAGITKFDSWYLTTTYGKNAEVIIKKALTYNDRKIALSLIKAEIEYTILYESATRPDDFFNRRTGKLYFDVYSVKNHFDFIIAEFKRHFEWSDDYTEKISAQCRVLIEDVTIFQD